MGRHGCEKAVTLAVLLKSCKVNSLDFEDPTLQPLLAWSWHRLWLLSSLGAAQISIGLVF